MDQLNAEEEEAKKDQAKMTKALDECLSYIQRTLQLLWIFHEIGLFDSKSNLPVHIKRDFFDQF